MQPVLSVRDLSVEFLTRDGPLRALDRVSFEIGRGEILGMVGESGAGKSLTGAAITGLLAAPGRISGGEIVLSGTRIDTLGDDAMRPLRGRRIGMIFQDPMTSLDPLMRIGDQLVETLLTHMDLTRRQARARAIDLLGETGIPDPAGRVDAYPHEFSGGMRQRVVIALALSCEPDLLIADEPTTALDVSVQAQIIRLLQGICRDRRTAILLISHDMGLIGQTAQRVAVLYAGRVVETGTAAEVVRHPLHPYTAGLMAAIPPLHRRPDRLVQIPGSMPRLDAIPPGCAYHPRCARCFAPCASEMPEARPHAGRLVACHLFQPDAAAASRTVAGSAA